MATVFARSLDGYKVELQARGHTYLADEPEEAGGTNAGPNPYDLLLSALAACKLITMRMYAERKGWPFEGAELRLKTYKVHVRDCEDCESEPNTMVDIIEVEMTIHGDLTDEQRRRIAQIADRCPVHRTLTGEIKIRGRLAEAA